MRKIAGIFFIPLLLAGTTYSKSIEELIKEMTEDLVTTYTQPLVTAFGTAMNCGLYNTASAHKTLGFDLGLKLMLVPIPAEAKTANYNKVLTFIRTSPTTYDTGFTEVTGSTVFGDTHFTDTPHNPPDTICIPNELPGGVNLAVLPLIVPQLSVGIYKGNEVMIRYVSFTFEGTKISLLGLGLKQNFNALLPMLPIDLGVQFAYQSFKLGEILTSTNTNINLHASKSLSIPGIGITPYVGVGLDNTNMRLKYDFEFIDPYTGTFSQAVDVSVKGENSSRTVLGLRLKLFVFTLNADYNIGKYPSFSIGSCISFR